MILNGFWVLIHFGSSTGKVKTKGPSVWCGAELGHILKEILEEWSGILDTVQFFYA